MSFLELQNITKIYPNGTKAVNETSLNIENGEFVVFVGPSGCGKSTLLRMIAGLEDIDDGVIKIEDKVINKISPADRDIAMVFQNYALYPHMNVYKNLSYGLKNRKVPKSVIEQKVQEIASLLQIEDLLFRKPSELSGGQRQRVAMGRAIIREPKVFLFDEPLSNLDAKLRQQMRLEIRKLHKKLNITSIYVTHDQIEAMTLADRIVVMNKGSIEQVGTPHEIYNNPQTLFVAKFMGTPPMNIFLSKIVDDSIDFFGNLIKLNSKIDDDEVYVGIRAEDISLHEGKDTIKLHIKIELIERLGRENLIYTTIDGSQLTLKTNDSINENLSSVDIYIDRKNFYFFDKRDKKQISRLVE